MGMIRGMRRLTLAVAIAIALSAVGAFATPASARDVTFRLYVSSTEGWGYTNTSLAIPGPTLAVLPRDNVTLILNATSGIGHRWYLDYDNDAVRDANEPQSPTFSAGGAEISWNFTADRNGTFVYRSRVAPSMWGLMTVGVPGAGPVAPSEAANLILVGLVAALVAFTVGLVIGRRVRMAPPPPPPPMGR